MDEKLNPLIKDLNENQKKAVVYNKGHLRIIAGAGSGKTSVLTRKIAYLIESKITSPQKILAVTFTNKAANEMSERVEGLVNLFEKNTRPLIATFHSFCNLVLRREIKILEDFNSNFDILDTTDQKIILESIYQKLNYNFKDISYSSALETISKWKNLQKFPENINSENLTEKELMIYEIYKHYELELKKIKVLDFDDLMLYTLKIFENFPNIANKWKNRYSHILIDEFQDTSIIQLQIIEHLISDNNKVTVVGDPNQTIYSWRGADAKLINDFHKKIKNVHTIKLAQNYRSTKNILNSANKLIKNNKIKVDNDLFTDKEHSEDIEFYQGLNIESEVRWVVGKINELKKKKSQLKNIAVLYRSNFYSRYFEEQFIKENIPFKILGQQKFYEKKIVKDVIAYLKVIDNGSTIALTRIINVPSRKIGLRSIQKMNNYAKKRNLSLFDTLIEYFRVFNAENKDLELQKSVKLELHSFLDKVNRAKMLIKQNQKISVVIDKFLKAINYFSTFNNPSQNLFEIKESKETYEMLLQSIRNWEKQNPTKNLSDYLSDISMLTDLNSSDVSTSINLMTIHNSKGLEFDNVFLVGMSEGILPNRKALDNPDAIEEERRLAYVGITRAKERLFISNSSRNFLDDKKNSIYKTSRFVKELDIKSFKLQTFTQFDKNGKLSYSTIENTNNLSAGDLVNHLTFGCGTVLAIESDIAVISFKDINDIKKIKKDHKSLEKIV
ncbi:ATP-dependent helicase [[Mycoplasma] collis]|uniref:ATP-dependent helicase n=1 Tax=[Mycoplasma] collis TaxID=2127 RepID=UPI00051C5E3E|nr:UvrD-helicase domain-containing protein [[Mycoplasma] collis]